MLQYARPRYMSDTVVQVDKLCVVNLEYDVIKVDVVAIRFRLFFKRASLNISLQIMIWWSWPKPRKKSNVDNYHSYN